MITQFDKRSRAFEFALRKSPNAATDYLIQEAEKILKFLDGTSITTAASSADYTPLIKECIDFIEENIKLNHPTKGLIPFNMYAFQKDAIKNIISNNLFIVNSSRQTGISCTILGYAIWKCLITERHHIGLLCPNAATMKYIYDMACNSKHNNQVYTYNREKIEFSNGSTITWIQNATDYVNNIKNTKEIIVADAAYISYSLLRLLTDTPIKSTYYSTPSKPEGPYYELWEAKKSGVAYMAIPWYFVPTRTQEWMEDMIDQIGQDKFDRDFNNKFMY